MSNLCSYLKDSFARANEQFNQMIEREPLSFGRPFWIGMSALSARCTLAEIDKEQYFSAAACVALSVFSVYTLSHLNRRFVREQREAQQEDFRRIRTELGADASYERRHRRIQERIALQERSFQASQGALQNFQNLGG